MLAPKMMLDSVSLVLRMLGIILFRLGDPQAKKPATADGDQLLLLMDAEIILTEYRRMSLEGEIIAPEHIWDSDEKFGEVMHKCMYDAHRKYFPHLGTRDELYEVLSRVLKSISRDSSTIPEGKDMPRVIGFFRHMERVAQAYRERRESATT